MDKPKAISLVEVGLRDGIQNEKSIVPTETKLAIVGMLVDAGFQGIQVASFVHPKRVPQMADADLLGNRLDHSTGLFSALVLNFRGLERAISAGFRKVDLSISSSETHSLKNTGMSLAKAEEDLEKMLAAALTAGLKIRVGLQCAFGCKYEGKIDLDRLSTRLKNLPLHQLECVMLADSPGLAQPDDIKETINAINLADQNIAIGLHLHNTSGFALENMKAGIECGIQIFDTALGGLGGCPFIEGAEGNLATEAAITQMAAMGISSGIQTQKVAPITAILCKALAAPGRKNSERKMDAHELHL